MANPHKGELEISIEGKPYTLVFDANATCEIEDCLGRGWLDIGHELDSWVNAPPKETAEGAARRIRKIKFSVLRAILWGMLRTHHSELSLLDVGKLMNSVGDQEGGALGVILKTIARGMPPPVEGQTENPKPPG